MAVERRAQAQDVAKQLFGREITSDREDDPFFDVSLEHLFGEIWSRPGLAIRDRSLVTCTVLAALYRTPELKGHLQRALDNGVTVEELKGMITHVAFYSGWPTAVNAGRVLQEVLGDDA